jgi:hypothetical protein
MRNHTYTRLRRVQSDAQLLGELASVAEDAERCGASVIIDAHLKAREGSVTAIIDADLPADQTLRLANRGFEYEKHEKGGEKIVMVKEVKTDV